MCLQTVNRRTPFNLFWVCVISMFLSSVGSNAIAQNRNREMRGIWVATVNNIDWPSKPGLSTNELKHEITDILNNIEHTGLNCVFLQIRACAAAFYQSDIEPWSVYLTG